jgi:cytochrome c oxidase subunit 2
LLFLAVPVLGTAIVIGVALQTPFAGYWLPDSIGPRTVSIDGLMNLVHSILGAVFLLTGTVLALSLWRFSAQRPGKASPRRGSLVLELTWTLIPAGILGWLAFHQATFWNLNKVEIPLTTSPDRDGNYVSLPPVARVVARQFEWTFIYPGQDGEFDTRDDIVSPGLLVLPQGVNIVLELTSEDVIHSFAINTLRLKQDVVPGLDSRIWFNITQTGDQEINCMELCGWGHYRMAATLRVVTPAEFAAWRGGQNAELQR